MMFLVISCDEESNSNKPPFSPPEPQVQILSPENNSVILDSTIVTVRATDDNEIVRVEIYINHDLNNRIYTGEPYEYIWKTDTLADGSQHIIYAKAYDDDGNVSTSSIVTVTHYSFFAPYISTFNQLSKTQLEIHWWDGSTGEDAFKIERRVNDGPFIEIGEVSQDITTYQDNNLDTAKTCAYRIRAFRDPHYSNYSNILRVAYLIEGVERRIFYDYGSDIYDAKFNPSGNIFACGGAYNGIMIWDTESGNVIKEIWDVNIGNVSALDFNPESSAIVSGQLYGGMKLWKISDGSLLRVFSGHNEWVKSVQISSSGQYIVSGSTDGVVKLWNYNNESPIYSIPAHTGSVNHVTFTPDENYFISSGNDNKVVLWDLATGNNIDNYLGYLANVSPDGQLLSIVTDNQINILDFNTSTLITSIISDLPKISIQFSPDKQLLAFSSEEFIYIYLVNDGRFIGKLIGQNSPVTSISFSNDGDKLLSGGLNDAINIWDIVTFKWLEL